MMDGEEVLSVSVLEWMADTGYLLRLQQQCENYQQAGRVGQQPAPPSSYEYRNQKLKAV